MKDNKNIFNSVLEIFKENYICDHCLGRQYAKILTGYSNKERGFSIRTFIMMALIESNEISNITNVNILKNINYSSKENSEKCWVCQNLFNNLLYWKNEIISKINEFEYTTFLIGTKLNGLLSENEEVLWELIGTSYSEPLKSEVNRELGKLVSKEVNKIVNFLDPDILINVNLQKNEVEISVKPLYISGQYNKYVRGIPQTTWPCRLCNGAGCEKCNNSGRKYNTSVAELIGNYFIEESKGSEFLFHGAGREDIDALMLGNGRYFVLEVKNPKKRNIDLQKSCYNINQRNNGIISVSNLIYCTKNTIKKIKVSNLSKTYRIKVVFQDNISNINLKEALFILSNSTIMQRTPTRVAHRRADMIREKKIYKINLECINKEEKYIILTINCDGGLYIKELISGDFERTKPNLSTLVCCSCIVAELDVIDIENLL